MPDEHQLTAGDEIRGVPSPPILRLVPKEKDQDELRRFSFASHLLADEDNVKSGVVYSILKSAWRPKGGLEVHEQSKNTFIFLLSDEIEKDRIFQESPWFVKGSHIILKEWPDSQRFDEIAFSHSAFWVQVHGLPKGCMTLENIQLIGSLFPRLISWDKSTLGGLESFLRLRVEIDVHLPLLSGFQFRMQGDEICSAVFKYEKLVDFCYRCGMLGHTQKTCTDFRWKDEDGNYLTQPRPQYGPHMRVQAYSPRKHFGSIRETKQNPQLSMESPAHLAPLRRDAKQPVTNTPVNTEPQLIHDVEGTPTLGGVPADDERVNQLSSDSPPKAFIACNPSCSDIITHPAGGSQSSLPSTPTPEHITPPLNAMVTEDDAFLSVQTLECSSTSDEFTGRQQTSFPIQIGPEQSTMDVEVGFILSEQVKAHLSLGRSMNIGQKRKTEMGPLEHIFKRARIRDAEASEFLCSPAQLQAALALDRSEFHKQDQQGFFTNVNETITVKKVRRRIRQQALTHHVRFKPDARFSLLQDFHPTQIPFNDPPVIPELPLVNTTPATLTNMNILSWNCQGLGQALTRRVLKDLIFKHRPCLVFLMETKQTMRYLEGLRRRLSFANRVYVNPQGYSGGLALWWTDDVHISIFSADKNLFDGSVSDVDYNITWHFSFIYGEPNIQMRRDMWRRVIALKRDAVIPWLLMGDLNLVGDSYDKKGKRPPLVTDRRLLEELTTSCCLRELAYRGARYTWSRGSISERLDRALSNERWSQLFPNAQLFHCTRIGSDHCPLLLCLKAIPVFPRKQFRYELKWQQHREYEGVIAQGWATERPGSPLYCMSSKLAHCRKHLMHWWKHTGRNSRLEVERLQKELDQLQLEEQSEANLSQQRLLIDEINSLWLQEETHWFQRARTSWILLGDRNSKYFHAMASRRRQNNYIFQLKDDQGTLLEGIDSLLDHAYSHFQQAYDSPETCSFTQIEGLIKSLVTTEMNEDLCRVVSDEEIRATVFQMGALKAPGVDGFPGCFYQHHWDLVGNDVCRAVQHFFTTGFMLREMNKTKIVLIPKVKNPKVITQYRPISLCNFSYKVIAKILANRLKAYLNDLISPFQSAFVPGRSIHDNIIIAQEAFHGLHLKKSGKHGVIALKLDIRKAYDNVNWSCLEYIMRAHGFCDKWIHMVMQCVSTVSYTVGINGNQTPFFSPRRGLRQGDPLSPYLYLFIADILSRLLTAATSAKQLSGYRIRRWSPIISHLLFADDSLIFCQATTEEICQLQSILQVYGDVSGQKVNFSKSAARFSSNTPTEEFVKISTESSGNFGGANKLRKEKYAGSVGANSQKASIWEVWALKIYTVLTWQYSSFLAARKGSHPSWIWSSILRGRDIIQIGMRWNVGNGQNILIFEDRWVPTLPGFMVTSPETHSLFTYVCELLDDGGEWDITKLNLSFSNQECREILKIPTGACPDSFIWHYDKVGKFSVKSAYFLAYNMTREPGIHETNRDMTIGEWKQLWRLKIPPKVRVFLWRAILNSLPSLDNLVKRGVLQEMNCPNCQGADETLMHLLFFCPQVELIWFGSTLGLNPRQLRVNCFRDWWRFINGLAKQMGLPSLVDQSAIICWHLWKARNEKHFEHVDFNPHQILARISATIHDYSSSMSKNLPLAPSRSRADGKQQQSSWVRPPTGFLKVNVDASFSPQTGCAALAMVGRNFKGEIYVGESWLAMASSPLMAEAVALCKAAKYMESMGAQNVLFESDNQNFIHIASS
ncbi:hypothetical protein SLEP1_g47185 [Rubroshorea leprosula]|uniref:Reverse transcriptase domain-containing protein n=1 Tax=Rubroshorea leprosula TaxID=152421 RepID=A0AAV5LQK0_9ROSI|nr:hypothetical protein SLEP1_g47185 [Rubroshorea leprosula]